MKAVIDIKSDLIEAIQEEIRVSGFKGANEFINHAIEEFIATRKRGIPEEEKIPNIDDITSIETPDHVKFSNQKADVIAGTVGPPLTVQENSINFKGYFTKVKLTTSNLDKILPHNLPDIDPQKLQDFLSMLWGQINRLFAIKSALSITARAIILKGSDGFIHHQKFLDIVKFLSKDLTSLLNDIDSMEKTKFSVSFPRLNANDYDSEQKSMSRFINQYFWNIRRGNKHIDGALARLDFIKVYKDNDGFKICITPEGLEFLQIKNQIHHFIDTAKDSDSWEFQNKTSLSGEEVQFILNHIKNKIPNEYRAILQILKAVSKGYDNPSKLAQKLASYDIYGVTDKMRETNRNGVLARLVEMRMIKKERVARTSVKYLVTDDAVELLKKEEKE
tara:strand:+ start:1739 stop:2908 length:1170 start_codon:yes stop_codon:yes gene_type:complete